MRQIRERLEQCGPGWCELETTHAIRANVTSSTRFEDYRVVDGLRVPFRQVESNEQAGRTVYEVERVEFDVEVDDKLFVLRQGELK